MRDRSCAQPGTCLIIIQSRMKQAAYSPSLAQGVRAVPRAFLYLGPVTLVSEDLQRWCGRMIET